MRVKDYNSCEQGVFKVGFTGSTHMHIIVEHEYLLSDIYLIIMGLTEPPRLPSFKLLYSLDI